MHKCNFFQLFLFSPETNTTRSVARGFSLDVCSIYRSWTPSCGMQCLTKLLTPVQSRFKMLPHQIKGALHPSGTVVVEMNSAKASRNFNILWHLHKYNNWHGCVQKCLLAWNQGPATLSSWTGHQSRAVSEVLQGARMVSNLKLETPWSYEVHFTVALTWPG